MKGFSGIGLAWITATIVAITIATAAVGSVRSEVTDTPTALGVPASPAVSSQDQTQSTVPRIDRSVSQREAISSIDKRIPGTVSSAPEAVETTTTTETQARSSDQTESFPSGASPTTTSNSQKGDSSKSTTTAPNAATAVPDNPPAQTTSPTTSSTTSTSTTTTTTTTTLPEPEVGSYTRVIATEGGSISVLVTGDSVNFKRGFARDGWKLDLAAGGPSAVLVRYQRNDDPDITINIDARVVSGELVVTIFRSQ